MSPRSSDGQSSRVCGCWSKETRRHVMDGDCGRARWIVSASTRWPKTPARIPENRVKTCGGVCIGRCNGRRELMNTFEANMMGLAAKAPTLAHAIREAQGGALAVIPER